MAARRDQSEYTDEDIVVLEGLEPVRVPEAVPHLAELVSRALSEPTDTRIAWLEALQTG